MVRQRDKKQQTGIHALVTRYKHNYRIVIARDLPVSHIMVISLISYQWYMFCRHFDTTFFPERNFKV